MKWTDISSFNVDDKVCDPCSFHTKAGYLTIVVTRHRYHEPTDWVLQCEPWFDNVVISNGTAEEAQKAAEKAVLVKLTEAIAELEKE